MLFNLGTEMYVKLTIKCFSTVMCVIKSISLGRINDHFFFEDFKRFSVVTEILVFMYNV